jgi:hypothetical protein
LVGLDHNYDPLPLDDIVMNKNDDSSSPDNADEIENTNSSESQWVVVPTIEIDAKHELLREQDGKTNASTTQGDDWPPPSTLIVESMDASQIDRDVARCTWHLLTGSQRSRRSQHRSIAKNSTRGSKYAQHQVQTGTAKANQKKLRRNQRHQNSAKYRRNRKVAVLIKKKQNRLANLINLTLVQSYDRSDGKDMTNRPSPNRLRYYQGYHDVACIFLHALGGAGSNTTLANNNSPSRNHIYRHYSSGDLELPSKVLCQISFSHFSDALRSDFLRLQTGLKLILFPLLSKIDRELHDHLMYADMEPFFCLSWILTWFAHDVRDTSLVKRLFDAFLVGHPALPVYTSLAMMTHPFNRQMVMETDCDFAALHHCLASLPKHSCKVGYKERKVDGCDVVTYVSDDEGSGGAGAAAAPDNATINTNTDSYLDEDESAFDDNDSRTFDSRSNYSTGDSIYTESSFPTSVVGSSSQTQAFQKPATISTIGETLASGSLASLQEQGYRDLPMSCPTDRTTISTEDPDFLSKESTLVSGKWNEPQTATTKNSAIDDHNPVPFETVLDTALHLMKTYPPNSLVDLAKSYYQDDWDSQLSLLSTTIPNTNEAIDVQEVIGLLSPTPPAWSILPTSTSDWIDKQKQRQDMGLKPTSRKDRRRRKQKKNMMAMKGNTANNNINSNDDSTSKNTRVDMTIDCGSPDAAEQTIDADEENNNPTDPMDYVRANPEDPVVAALGYGPGMEAKLRQRKLLRQQRRRRKRRRALMIGCGVVVIGAFVMYGGLKLTGSTGAPKGTTSDKELKPLPPLRQLRAVEDKSKGDDQTDAAAIRKAAGVLKETLTNPVSSETTTKSAPSSPARQKTTNSSSSASGNASLVLSTSPTAAPTNAVVSVRKSSRPPKLTLANHESAVLTGAIRKTKLFFTRFAHHLWIVCRGFMFPFKFLQQHPETYRLEYWLD